MPYDPSKLSKGIAICTSIFLFEMFADITSIAGSTKISHFFMLTKRSSVTASTLRPDLLMLADGTTTTFFTNWLFQIVRANLFSTTSTTGWSSFVAVTNFTSFAFTTNFFEPSRFTLSVLFAHFFVVQAFWTTPVNCAVWLLILKHSNNKKCLHFVHCFFSIFINHQAHEKYKG